jgi:hypothetical protein
MSCFGSTYLREWGEDFFEAAQGAVYLAEQ